MLKYNSILVKKNTFLFGFVLWIPPMWSLKIYL